MKASFLNVKSLLPSVLALLAIIGMTGCIEDSTVVKIKKDGSGIIHLRKFENTQAMAGALGGLGKGADKADDEEDKGPTEDEMKAKARATGEGVTLKSLRKGKNDSGWEGYEAIFAFEDINKVQLDLNKKDADEMKQPAPDAGDEGGGDEKDEAEAPQLVKFEMKDGVLKIKTPDPGDGKKDGKAGDGDEKNPAEGAQDPFKDDPQSAQMMAMMAPMFAGAKLGFFVEIDGEIAETNAKHLKEKMITIMRVDLGELFANPKALKKMDGMENGDREESQKIADSVDGVDMDLQDPIIVNFK